MKFMVVDDSNVIRTIIQDALKTRDFEIVGEAENGVEAVIQFERHKPQVMTLDITMPLMDGIETIRKIMAIDPDVRILVISALSDKKTLLDAIKLGASGFLCKPFDRADLIEAVEELIEDL